MYEGTCPTCGRDVGFIRMHTGSAWMVERTVVVGAQAPIAALSINQTGVLCATVSGGQARILAGEGTLRGYPKHDCAGHRGQA